MSINPLKIYYNPINIQTLISGRNSIVIEPNHGKAPFQSIWNMNVALYSFMLFSIYIKHVFPIWLIKHNRADTLNRYNKKHAKVPWDLDIVKKNHKNLIHLIEVENNWIIIGWDFLIQEKTATLMKTTVTMVSMVNSKSEM